MKRSMLLSVFVLTAILFTVTARAAIQVVSTKGEAAFLSGTQWKPLVKGQTIAEGTKISTGINSSAVLNIDGSLVTMKPLTSIKIYRNSVNSSTKETSLGLQYGTVQAKVDKVSKVRTKFNIATPVATSSVRGTEEIVSFGPTSGMKVDVVEGAIQAHNAQGASNAISGRQSFALSDAGAKPAGVLDRVKDDSSVSGNARNRSRSDNEFSDSYGDEYFEGLGDMGLKIDSSSKAKLKVRLDWGNY
jgi:hypothetical protein